MASYNFGYEGSDLKFLVEMTSEGFSMDDDEWSVGVQIGSKIVTTIPKEKCIKGEDGKWYVCVNKEFVKKGEFSLIAYAHVPDADFEDGDREEVFKQHMGNIQKV